jgi:hypothetical protein
MKKNRRMKMKKKKIGLMKIKKNGRKKTNIATLYKNQRFFLNKTYEKDYFD